MWFSIVGTKSKNPGKNTQVASVLHVAETSVHQKLAICVYQVWSYVANKPEGFIGVF